MKTKDKLLELFELNKGVYFSGEEIAQKLEVSRTAVWKAVKALRNEGYDISAVTNRGYSLSEKTDILSPQGIRKYLKSDYLNMDITVLSTIKSTNLYVREKAISGQSEGYTVFANEQTEGRGRYGRSFFSPYGTGIYMSVLLRPDNYSTQQAVRITTMAAVAMCEAIEAVSGEIAQIKWVNDIYVNDKKVCGILTEGSFDLESGIMEYAVLGVGVNVYYPEGGFPKELNQTVGAIFNSTNNDMKNKLAADFINRFMKYYTSGEQKAYIQKYRRRCFVIGKQITVISKGQTRKALAIDVDDECGLLVRYEDGKEECLSSGEIGIKVR